MNRIGRAWAWFRRNGESVYDRRELPIELNARLVKVEVVETLLHGCATWGLSAANYAVLNGAHRKFLTRVIGWRKVKRTDRPLSYAEPSPERAASRPSRPLNANGGCYSRAASCAWGTRGY